MRTDLRVKHDIEPGIAAIRFFVCSGAMRPRSTFVFPPCALQHCCKKSGCGRFFAGMPHNIVRLRIGVFRDLGKRIPRAAPAAFFGLKLRHTRKKNALKTCCCVPYACFNGASCVMSGGFLGQWEPSMQ